MGWPTLANQAKNDERSGSRKMPLSQVLDREHPGICLEQLKRWNLRHREVGGVGKAGLIYHQLQTSVKLILIGLRRSKVLA